MERSTPRKHLVPAAGRIPARGAALRVYVVEGDGAFGRQVARALEARGMVARAIVGGQAALDEVAIDRPDLIVLCAELPDLSGYAVCSRLKRNRDSESIPVILTSARADTRAFRSHRRLWVRADAYLRKPFEAQALADLLKKTAALVEVRSERRVPPRAPDAAADPGASRDDDEVLVDGFEFVDEGVGTEADVLEDGFVYLGGGPEAEVLEEGLVRVVVAPVAAAQAPDEVLETGFLYLGGGAEAEVLDDRQVTVAGVQGLLDDRQVTVAGVQGLLDDRQVTVAGVQGLLGDASRTSPGRWKLPAGFGAAA